MNDNIEWFLISKNRHVVFFGSYEPWNEDGAFEKIGIENPKLKSIDYDDDETVDGNYCGFKPGHPLADYVLRCLDSRRDKDG